MRNTVSHLQHFVLGLTIFGSSFLAGCENPNSSTTQFFMQTGPADSVTCGGPVSSLHLKQVKKARLPQPYASFTIATFQNEAKTWGFDIMQNGRLYVHQPYIAAVPEDIGYETEADARKVAQLIILKIENHILLPHVSEHEQDSLGVL